MGNTISILLPTISRPTLAKTLKSLKCQEWIEGDEVIVIADGHQPLAHKLWEQFRLPGRFIEVPGPNNDFGHTPRNLVMPSVTGDYLMAIDDDDELASGAIAAVRKALGENPGRPHLFRMTGEPCFGTVWKHQEVVERNVGTPMFVVPTAGQKWGRYTPRHGGDCDFIKSTLAMWPDDSVVWRQEIIALIRPNN